MKCKQCEYPLWNIAARQCPECGLAFRPSQYEFVPNSVKFCCTGCGQPYYGTDFAGHLSPPRFACVSCGKPCDMDEMVLLPADGVKEDSTLQVKNPWVERRRLGTWSAWWKTVGGGISGSGKLLRATPHQAPSGLWFSMLTLMVFSLVGNGLLCLPMMFGVAGAGGGLKGALPMFGVMLVSIAGSALAGALLTCVWILVSHWMLAALGGVTEPMRRTGQAVFYTTGGYFLAGVPCLGPYLSSLGVIWWAISAGVAVAAVHRAPRWKGIVATSALPALLVIAIIGLFTYFVYGAMGAGMAAGSFPPTPGVPTATINQANLTTIYASLTAFRAENGQYPEHAARMFCGNPLTPADAGSSGPQSATVFGMPLEQFQLIPDDEQQVLIDRFMAAHPGLLAHRVGNYVFTYHGVDPANHPEAWIVVYVTPGGAWTAFSANGSVSSDTDVATMLQAQNQARMEYGLFPLPDLTTVSDEAPAVTR